MAPTSLDEEIEAAVRLRELNARQRKKKKQTEEVEILKRMYGLPSPEQGAFQAQPQAPEVPRTRQPSEEGSEQPNEEPNEKTDEKPEENEDQDQKNQERLEAVNQQQRLQAEAGTSPEDTVKKAKKWVKWGERLMWVLEFLGATFPIWGPILLTLFIAVTFVGGCNNSIAFRIASLGACEPFIISGGRSGGAGGGGTFTTPGDSLTYAEAIGQLASAGIRPNGPQSKTDLEGIKQGTINEIINFANACSRSIDPNTAAGSNKCNVVFSGGTETNAIPPHAGGPCSHLSGHKADIGTNPQVNTFIRNTFTPSGVRGKDPQFFNPANGISYVDEGNHWDIGGVGCA